MEESSAAHSVPSSQVAKPVPPVTVESASLFKGGDEVRLLHRGQEYRLRVTKQGKLILTK